MGCSSSKQLKSSPTDHARSWDSKSQTVLGSTSSSSRDAGNLPPQKSYIPNPTSALPANAPNISSRAKTTEDVLQSLARFDTILLVDDSGSMRGPRWKWAKNALATLATVAARYDADGIDIEFLNSKTRGSGMKNKAAVEALFASVTPQGKTPLGTRLDAILRAYQRRLDKQPQKTKPLNLIVITDGAPTDGSATEDAIVRCARILDARNARTTQLGIQFVQIGNDARARAYLESLDDDLVKHGVRVRTV
ncbi:hypothetical protein H0H81_009864 [Sphagnurus paluster]|uniref:VWFA domain-containing protein n=1 Tax=Sphagnurus paluster TaxID=117069 RepID=A0A9P7FRX3_9AGAR|nr:hypothetical protein H0H81_009864 [Sphagnurus paluster]